MKSTTRSWASRCAAALLVGLTIARIARAADDSPSSYEFALDDQTELTLEPIVDNPKSWELDLRQYGTAAQGQVLVFMGRAEQKDSGLFELNNEYDGKSHIVRFRGNPAKGPVEVTSENLLLDSGQPAKIAGTFQPITPAARLERTKSRWQKADAVLNEVYASVRAEVGKAGESKLRDLQRGRISIRDNRATFEAHGAEKPESLPVYWDTMLGETVSNISFLKIYTGRDVPKGLTGSYGDASGGGGLDLEETPKGLKFSMTAVRGASLHEGEISGIAQLKGNRATYKQSSKEAAADGHKPAELTFTMSAGHIVHVDEKNTAYFGGAGVYFAGDYYKSGPLKAPIDLSKEQ